MRIFLLTILLASALSGCSSEPAISPEHNPSVIVTYDVPDGTAGEIASVVNSLLSQGNGQGRLGAPARVLPNGMVVVSAPASVQPGIEDFIDTLRDRPAEAQQRIRLHYWLVRGRPHGTSEVTEQLSEIEPALLETASVAGPMRFERLDYVQHVVSSGGNASVDGGVLRGRAEPAARGSRIALDLNLFASSLNSNVRTQMDLLDSENVVLAQMNEGQGDEVDSSSVLIYVVRAETF